MKLPYFSSSKVSIVNKRKYRKLKIEYKIKVARNNITATP